MVADESVIIRYLLGRLSDGERAAVEDRYLIDDSFFDAVQALEDELIRDYVCGSLSAVDRSDFEKTYLTNPHLRPKVIAVEALRAAAAEHQAASQPSGPVTSRPFAWFRSPGLSALNPAWAIAAIALAVGLWYGVKVLIRHPGQETAGARQKQSVESPAPRLASYVLLPGTSKGQPETSYDLLVPKDVKTVRLVLRLLGPAVYQDYTVELLALKPAGPSSILTVNNLKAENVQSGSSVLVDFDASILENEDYIVRMAGHTASGTLEDLPSYLFRIVKQG